MKTIFIRDLNIIIKLLLTILFIIIMILTFGLVFNKLYDFFFEYKYYRNRRILHKYLKSDKCKLLNIENNICGLKITTLYFEGFKINLYHDEINIAVLREDDNDTIGLFYSTIYEKAILVDIIKILNLLK